MLDFYNNIKRRILEKKVNKFVDLEKSLKNINACIDNLSDEFNSQKSYFTEALSGIVDDFSKSRISIRQENFNTNHLKEIGRVKRKKESILKSMNNLFVDDVEFEKMVRDSKISK